MNPIDPGMCEAEAKALAVEVRERTDQNVTVNAEGEVFVVTVRGRSGNVWTHRDAEDWSWLEDRIREAG